MSKQPKQNSSGKTNYHTLSYYLYHHRMNGTPSMLRSAQANGQLLNISMGQGQDWKASRGEDVGTQLLTSSATMPRFHAGA